MTTELVKFHETNIECPFIKGQHFISIESACAALGIEPGVQIERIKADPLLKDYIDEVAISANGSPRLKKLCLPLKFIFGWLFSVDAKDVAAAKRKALLSYKLDCYTTLYDHFYMRTALYEKKEKMLAQKVAQIENLMEAVRDTREKLTSVRKEYNDLLQTPIGQLSLELN